MPRDDPTALTEWFSSQRFWDIPEAKLLFAVIEQAIEDANMRIKDPPELPVKPKRKQEDSEEDWNIKAAEYKRKLTRARNRISHLSEMRLLRGQARNWLMSSDSNFPYIASKLGIDADVIREALTQEYFWAGEYRK